MRFRIRENIYDGDTNNKKNKRKYRHALSYFNSNAGNVPKAIEIFNKGVGEVADASAESCDGGSCGTANESLNESSTPYPTYTYSYKGPVYRFEKVYTVLDKPIYTTAQNREQAMNQIRGKLKKQFGFDYKAKLDIDDDDLRLAEHSNDITYQVYQNNQEKKKEKDMSGASFVGSVNDEDIYYLDGYYVVNDNVFASYEDAKDYLEA